MREYITLNSRYEHEQIFPKTSCPLRKLHPPEKTQTHVRRRLLLAKELEPAGIAPRNRFRVVHLPPRISAAGRARENAPDHCCSPRLPRNECSLAEGKRLHHRLALRQPATGAA